MSRRPDPWVSSNACAEVAPNQRRSDGPDGRVGAGAHGARALEAANDVTSSAPIRADAAAHAARRERGAAVGVAVDLAAFAIAAATTIVIFFGIAFVQLRPPATPTVSQPLLRARSAIVAALPLTGVPGHVAGNADPAVPKLAEPIPARRRDGDAAASPPTAKRAGFMPQPGAVRATAAGEIGVRPQAAAHSPNHQAPNNPPNDQAPSNQAAGLLTRGDAFLRAGDVASARLFYERAADGGDAQAALRAGATFDPIFLASIGLRMRGDPARALDWYRRALALGASNAEPYLHRLESK